MDYVFENVFDNYKDLDYIACWFYLGAKFIERHITLDRAMWGTDQAASVEIMGLYRLISNIRDIEKSFGDGIKKVYTDENGNYRCKISKDSTYYWITIRKDGYSIIRDHIWVCGGSILNYTLRY